MTVTELPPVPPIRLHRPFALVLSGGGVRGLAHVGVLRALEHYGYRPSAVVGVSMGGIVGATYALNSDWQRALTNMDSSAFPITYSVRNSTIRERARALIAKERFAQDMLFSWGVGHRSLSHGQRLLRELTLDRRLEEGHLPVALVATDLLSGKRVVLRHGNAAEAAYASAALPGVLQPLARDGQLLGDGACADNAPIDVARELVSEVVIAVNPDQAHSSPILLRNGLQVLMRALEICHAQHAHLRFAEADLVLQPTFPYPIDLLDFTQKRLCVAAGVWAVRRALPEFRRLLDQDTVETVAPPSLHQKI